MPLKNYDSKAVAMVFLGIPISGLAEDTFVTVDRNEDSFNLTIGADGEGARSKSNNKSGTVTFRTLQTADCNDFLTAAIVADEASSSGVSIGPLLVKDNSGRSLYTAEKAWIRKPPQAAYARGIEVREWVVETDALIMGVAGN